MSTPVSPALTHASSSFDEIDSWLTLNEEQFQAPMPSDTPLFEPHIAGESPSGLLNNVDMGELFRQYMNSDKLPDAPPMLTPSLYGSISNDASPLFAPSAADASFDSLYSIDPLLVTAESPALTTVPEENEQTSSNDVDMAEDELLAPPVVETTPALSPTPSSSSSAFSTAPPVTRQSGKAKATRVSSRKTSTSHKSSVADLAIPGTAIHSTAKPTPADKEPASIMAHKLPHLVFAVPDYVDRPSEEEYKKLNSKEKRQMRNKISARNFRHRRKEYITTLEEEISTRDTTISALQDEMSTLRVENSTLRTDLDSLKATMEQLLLSSRPAEPIAPSRPLTPRASTSNSIIKPNLGKDKSSINPQWGAGGLSSLNNLGVHTTFVPSPLAMMQRNMNPKLNGLSVPKPEAESAFFFNSAAQALFSSSSQQAQLDRYRGTLYSKLAHNLNGSKLAAIDKSAFQPSFFSSPSTETPSSPSSDASVAQDVEQTVERQTALVASIAKHTLVSGLLTHFWSTFSTGQDSKPGQSVADLLSGKAELKIVPRQSRASIDELSSGLEALGLQQQETVTTRTGYFGFQARKA